VERRKTLHEKIARTLEAQSPGRLDDRCADLAHHYERSGNADKAVEYLELAAVQARDRSAGTEAIRHGAAALELLDALPNDARRLERELALQSLLGTAWMAVAGYGAPEVERSFARAREICRTLGDPVRAWPVLGGLAVLSFVRADFAAARALGDELAAMSSSSRDPMLGDSHLTRGWTALWTGDFDAAQDHAERALSCSDLAKPRSHLTELGQDSPVTNLHCLALALWFLGRRDEARRKSEEATARARALSHPFTLAFSLAHEAWLRDLAQETAVARERAEEALALATDGGFVLWAAMAGFVRGWSLAEQGRNEGIAEMESALELWEGTGARVFGSHIRGRIAEARARRGESESALAVLERALRDVETTGERWCEAELRSLRGAILAHGA
jgi:tetratricopeptide (TPR) repeat protein